MLSTSLTQVPEEIWSKQSHTLNLRGFFNLSKTEKLRFRLFWSLAFNAIAAITLAAMVRWSEIAPMSKTIIAISLGLLFLNSITGFIKLAEN
jgi:hypothetical protein